MLNGSLHTLKKMCYGGKFLRALLYWPWEDMFGIMLKGHIQWIILKLVPLALRVNCRQKNDISLWLQPFPGQVECSPRSNIYIVSLNVLSYLQFSPWPWSILNLFFLTFMPRFQWIPAFPCAAQPSYFCSQWNVKAWKTEDSLHILKDFFSVLICH